MPPKLDTAKYTTRRSPPFHAKDFPDKEKKGNDGQMYVSTADKNGVYKWNSIDSLIKYKPTPQLYYEQFPDHNPVIYDVSFITKQLPKLIADLKKIGVKLYIIKWTKKLVQENPMFEYEYFESDNHDKLIEGTYLYFSERMLYFASTKKNGQFGIHHSLNHDITKSFNGIFCKYFPGRTNGYMTDAKVITIEMVAKKRLKREKDKKYLGITFLFTAKKLIVDGQKLFPILSKIIGKHGFVSEFDLAPTGRWFAGVEINLDVYNAVKTQISGLKKLGTIDVAAVKLN
jgi:hypothetical protein